MRIIEPSFEVINPKNREAGIDALRFIERMARISHRSEDLQTADSWDRFIRAVVIAHGDWSVVEHSHATVIFRVDRGFMAEITRHRLASYTIESTRFVNYSKREMEFIEPAWKSDFDPSAWKDHIKTVETLYLDMLEKGTSPQIARSILPNSLATTISLTSNLRNWRHMFMMRVSKEAHPDMKRIMIPLLEEFKRRIPILYDDIEADIKQNVSISRAR